MFKNIRNWLRWFWFRLKKIDSLIVKILVVHLEIMTNDGLWHSLNVLTTDTARGFTTRKEVLPQNSTKGSKMEGEVKIDEYGLVIGNPHHGLMFGMKKEGENKNFLFDCSPCMIRKNIVTLDLYHVKILIDQLSLLVEEYDIPRGVEIGPGNNALMVRLTFGDINKDIIKFECNPDIAGESHVAWLSRNDVRKMIEVLKKWIEL